MSCHKGDNPQRNDTLSKTIDTFNQSVTKIQYRDTKT